VPTREEMANIFEHAFTEDDDTPNLSTNRGSARHGHRDALMMATPRLVQVQKAALAGARELQSPSPRAVGEVTSAEHKTEAQSDLEEASETQPVFRSVTYGGLTPVRLRPAPFKSTVREGAEASSLGFDEAQMAKKEAESPLPPPSPPPSPPPILEWHVKPANQLQAELATEKLQCAKLREECTALQKLSASLAHTGPIESANEAALRKQVEMLTADKMSLDRQLKEAQHEMCERAGIAEEREKRGQDAERMVA
jgi:hypothetical protein